MIFVRMNDYGDAQWVIFEAEENGRTLRKTCPESDSSTTNPSKRHANSGAQQWRARTLNHWPWNRPVI